MPPFALRKIRFLSPGNETSKVNISKAALVCRFVESFPQEIAISDSAREEVATDNATTK